MNPNYSIQESPVKWYLYGLSANPPTKAHYEIIKYFDSLNEQLTVFPCYRHPIKTNLIDFTHRVNMLNLMCSNFKNVHVSTLEQNIQPNTTFELIVYLRSIVSLCHETLFVIVCDCYIMMDFLDLNRWNSTDMLNQNDIQFCVIFNDNNDIENDKKLINEHENKRDTVIAFVVLESINESIRSTIARNDSQRMPNIVPKCVYDYIVEHNITFSN